MALYEQRELEERLNECARIHRIAEAGEQAFRKVQQEVSVVAEWLRVLEFRLRYAEHYEDKEDED